MVRRATRRVLVTAALIGLVACTPAPTPSPSPSVTPTETPSASPSQVTPSFSTEQRAAADVVVKFYEIQNQIATNYEVPLDALYQVAGGDLAQTRLQELQQWRGREWRQTGAAVPEVRNVVSDTQPFQVDVCVDTTALDIVDSDGNSVVAEGNPTLVLHRFTVANVGGTLRAVQQERVETPC